MAKHPNLIPSQQLNVALPLPVYTQLSAHLYSELEGRIPHGAYSRHLTDMLRNQFSGKSLDLAPWVGSAPGAFVVQGSAEAIRELELCLTAGRGV
jgi:hypothetical protein